MKIATINVRGLNDFKKQEKLDLFCKLEKYDIVFIQESHINTLEKAALFDKVCGGKTFWSFGTNQSCGVAIHFRPNLKFI